MNLTSVLVSSLLILGIFTTFGINQVSYASGSIIQINHQRTAGAIFSSSFGNAVTSGNILVTVLSGVVTDTITCPTDIIVDTLANTWTNINTICLFYSGVPTLVTSMC